MCPSSLDLTWWESCPMNHPLFNELDWMTTTFFYTSVFSCEGIPTLPPNFEEDTWAKLKSAIGAIFLKQPVSCDLENLYQISYLVVLIELLKLVLI